MTSTCAVLGASYIFSKPKLHDVTIIIFPTWKQEAQWSYELTHSTTLIDSILRAVSLSISSSKFFVVGGGDCPVLCGLFSSTPALYPLDASSKPPTSHYTSYPLPLSPIPPRILFRFPPSRPTIMKTKNVTRQCKMSLGGKITSGWNYWHRNMCSFLNLFSLYCVILPNEIAPFWLIKVSRSPQF